MIMNTFFQIAIYIGTYTTMTIWGVSKDSAGIRVILALGLVWAASALHCYVSGLFAKTKQ